MISCAVTRLGDTILPFSVEDLDAIRELPVQVAIRSKFAVARKQRSYQQLKLWRACCRTVAANTDDPNWDHYLKVAEQVKLILRYVKSWMVTPDGTVHIVTQSLSYADLGHLEACRFFERAWPILADKIGVTVEQLLAETESEMRWRAG